MIPDDNIEDNDLSKEDFGNVLATSLSMHLENVTEGIQPEEDEEKVTFIDNHIPALKSGMYTIRAYQEVQIPGGQAEKTGTIEKHIYAGGSRFSVSPDMIHAVFPPANSSADYAATFPHIAFSRASVPWEVETNTKMGTPWLALVLFYEDEIPEIHEEQLDSLKDMINLPSFQNGEQLVRVIQIPDTLLPRDPEWCCHVRQTVNEKSKELNETAWIISNRLPKAGMKNKVHLISLADKLKDNRFISLYHWEFDCHKGRPNFTGLIKDMTIMPYRYYPPKKSNRYFREGYIALPHFLRLGYQTLSLYQSPLLPYSPVISHITPERTVFTRPKYGYERVEWVKLDDKSNMADVSFAAAFHLGKMLTIANKQVAQTIFKWKRQFYQSTKKAYLEKSTQKYSPDLLIEQNTNSLPDLVIDWVTDFLTLKKIPFNYLVPHHTMLPENSIRFFRLHKKWLKNCLDGVFSIGEEYFNFNSEDVLFQGDYSGFIMRNPVISHYPEIEVTGYFQEGRKEREAELFFIRKLSPEVIICCFKDSISRVEISLPASVMYFGLKEEMSGVEVKNGFADLANLANSLNCKTPSGLAVRLIKNSPKVKISSRRQSGK